MTPITHVEEKQKKEEETLEKDRIDEKNIVNNDVEKEQVVI